MFRRGRLHETEITESLIAISQRRKLGRGLGLFRKEGRSRQPLTPDMPGGPEGRQRLRPYAEANFHDADFHDA